MNRIAVESGRVGHIVADLVAGNEYRIVKTLCGNSFPEYEISVNNELDVCKACDNKLNGVVEDAVDLVVSDEKPVEVEEKPKPKTPTKK